MPIVFFDTETTGLPDKRAGLTASHQPHVIQLAALLTSDDGIERSTFNLLVHPGPDVVIPPEASAVHGISTELVREFGVAPKLAAVALKVLMRRASLVVAHNLAFDVLLMQILGARCEVDIVFPERRFCTMQATTPVLNLPPTAAMRAKGIHKPKSPKLMEAYTHYFSRGFEGAHDALSDVRACRDVFIALGGMNAVDRQTSL